MELSLSLESWFSLSLRGSAEIQNKAKLSVFCVFLSDMCVSREVLNCLDGSLSEGNGMEHPFLLFSQNLKFSFSPKLGGIGGNKIFIKTPKMPYIYIYIFLNPRLSLIPDLHLLTPSYAAAFISNLRVFFLFFIFYFFLFYF